MQRVDENKENNQTKENCFAIKVVASCATILVGGMMA